ncbi:HD domain-containing protein [Methanobacterium aggregans]|uniref:HD domain-containing protein n=1 Tax=Methanobacterium aggregans TaxID=1615586 RepID=UPI001AE446DC|nr:HD domain-containing protein [Methanobacterium aggregans]MBP2046016.1 putative hydrolase of HD superfamily [Methanobacterium aggregans]
MKKEASIARLTERFTKAASMQRWNDHIRPVELTELDKQAHKMIIAYLLAKSEEDRRDDPIDWRYLIEAGIFEFLQRLVLTDIKAPVFHQMRENPETRKQMDEYVFKELKNDLKGLNKGFGQRFQDYFSNPHEMDIERRILRAAHYLATNWEFKIIYHTAPFIYGIEETKKNIEDQIEDHYDLIGVQKISLEKKSFGFIDLCGQLRFQKRWARTPRIPETSVLGHMLIVAILSYICTMEMNDKACNKRFYNNYFSALFHDLPEVLTKDIISPVKKVADLDEVIKGYEKQKMEEKLLTLLPKIWRSEMRYFTEDEFNNKIIEKNEIKSVTEISKEYNNNEFSPLDGKLLEECDKLAAFIEASLSIKHGVKSEELVKGKEDIYSEYKNEKIQGIDFEEIFKTFY